MATDTKLAETKKERPEPKDQIATIGPPRLPYHPAIGERFGVGKAEWKALCEAIFPGATSTESIVLALSYCKARMLDPFKRNVHIVPIWDNKAKRYTDTIWPGIGELRTTAFRTGEYAGRSDTVFGEAITETVGKMELTYPEFAQVTVRRVVKDRVVEFSGPRVYWKETYASARHDDPTPNSMWAKRPRGQIEKCAEAAALRAAFPEEIGSEMIADETQGSPVTIDAEKVERPSLETVRQRLEQDLRPVGTVSHTGPIPSDEELAQEDQEDPGDDLEAFRQVIRRKLDRCDGLDSLEKTGGQLLKQNREDKARHQIVTEEVCLRDADIRDREEAS